MCSIRFVYLMFFADVCAFLATENSFLTTSGVKNLICFLHCRNICSQFKRFCGSMAQRVQYLHVKQQNSSFFFFVNREGVGKRRQKWRKRAMEWRGGEEQRGRVQYMHIKEQEQLLPFQIERMEWRGRKKKEGGETGNGGQMEKGRKLREREKTYREIDLREEERQKREREEETWEEERGYFTLYSVIVPEMYYSDRLDGCIIKSYYT